MTKSISRRRKFLQYILLSLTVAAGGLATSIAPVSPSAGITAYLADGSSYFSELPRGGGIKGLYRSITRPDSGVVRKKKRSASTEKKTELFPTKKTARLPARSAKTKRKTLSTKKAPATRKASVRKKTNRRVVGKSHKKRYKKNHKKTVRKRAPRYRKSASARGKKIRRKARSARFTRRARSRRDIRRRGTRTRAHDRTRTRKVTTASARVKKSRRRSSRRSSVSRFRTTLTPTPKKGYKYRTPDFYRGIYLTFGTASRASRYKPLLRRARAHGVNVLVVDVQPRLPPKAFTKFARENDFYLVSRVVVFPGGLKKRRPSRRRIEKVLRLAEASARNGYMEVQFDYIRFADPYGKHRRRLNLSLRKRYRVIEGVLKEGTDRLRPLGVRVGADIFGRIPFNRNDVIGQKVELFAAHLDTLYPMLYPSHFYGDPGMIRNPYRTILKGKKNCIRRSRGQARVIAYIQGFKMKVRGTGLSYTRYIQKQIQASEDSGGAGYIVWNARNKYGPFFRAVKLNRQVRENLRRRKKTREISRNP